MYRTCRMAICMVALVLLSPSGPFRTTGQPASASGPSTRPVLVAEWSILHVLSWFDEIGIPSQEFADSIEKEKIDGEALLELSIDEWKDFIGIKALGHRKKLEKGLKELRERGGRDARSDLEPTPSPPTTQTPTTKSQQQQQSEETKSKGKPKTKQQKQRRVPDGVSVLSPEASMTLFGSNTVKLPPLRSVTPDQERQAGEHTRQAIGFHQRNQWKEAMKEYELALAIQPRHARALHMFGLVLIQVSPSKDFKRAEIMLLQSIALAPNEPDTLLNLGNLYWSRSQPDPSTGGRVLDADAVRLALVSWARSLELGPTAGGPPLRMRFAETLYSEALRVYSSGRKDLAKEYLHATARLCSEAIFMHFPSDYFPPMGQEMQARHFRKDTKTGQYVLKKPVKATQGAGGDEDPSKQLASFLSSTPLALLENNLELTHGLRTILADALLHLGMIHEQAEETLPTAVAFYQRTLEILPDTVDKTKPPEVRISTIHAEAKGYLQKILPYLERKGRMGELPKAREELLAYEFSTWLGNNNELSPSEPSPSRSRTKKLIEFLHKSCKISPAFSLARHIHDDTIFHSPRYPHLYESEEEMVQTRAVFEARLDHLLANEEYTGLWSTGQGLEWCRFRFYLAYHGINDITILTKLSRVYKKMTPVLEYTSPHLLEDPTNGLSRESARSLSTRSNGGRIRVAFISAFLSHHPVGKTVQGWIHHLDRARYEVIVYFVTLQGSLEGKGDQVYERIKSSADIFRTIPPESWPLARATIEEDAPDILIYPDLGMEATTYFLAFSRLAPIQAMTFGHPDSSGIEGTMDYFISHQDMDDDDPYIAQSYYSEKLVRLPGVGYWYPALLPTTVLDRAYFGLSDKDLIDAGVHFGSDDEDSSAPVNKYTLYLVTKAVQFFSPSFLDALAGILFRHPRSFLVLLMDTGKNVRGYDVHNACLEQVHDGIENRLRQLRIKHGQEERSEELEARVMQNEAAQRLSRHPNFTTESASVAETDDVLKRLVSHTSFPQPRPPISGRIRFVDKGDHEYFMNLLRVSDVLLQPMPLDGTTTTLEAVTMHTPTVVYRGPMIGGRMAYAIYKHMGLTETIAHSIEEYIDIAVRLGTDPSFAHSVRQKLKAVTEDTGPNRLFENPAAINAYALWIEMAVMEKIADN